MPGPEAARGRHLLHIFSTFAVGGPQVRLAAVANRLGRKYRHSIVAMDGNYGCAERLDPALDVRLTPLAVNKGAGLSLANLRTFRKQLKELRPDLLLTYNWGTIEWALANRLRPLAPHLHFEDGFGPDETDGRQLPHRIWTRGAALSGGTRIVVPSRTLERLALRRWRFSPRRVRYVPNGVDCARFERQPDPARLGRTLPAGAQLIGAVGGLRPEKNLARLVRAVAALPAECNAHLVLVGEGPERPALEALAAKLGIGERTIFTGRINDPEAVLALVDVYALSSDTEQMPLSLVEAMAAGLPAVSTDVGDVREMVAEENRPFIVGRSDERAFAAALADLLGAAEKRRRIGEANRARARAEYDEARMVETYDLLFGGGWTR